MLAHEKSPPLRRRAPIPAILLVIIGSSLALAACAAGSGFDRKQAYRDAAARCVGARDEIVCRDEQQHRIIDEGYASICRGKGIADNSPAMTRCKGELAYADCVRSISDYQGYINQMSSRAPSQPPPSDVCKHHLGTD